MDLATTTSTTLNEDHTWLRSDHGVDDGETVELDVSLFTEADHFPDGFIPSGVVLGKVTATGVYGPYDNALSNGQETAAGHLLHTKRVTRPDGTDATIVVGSLFTHGRVIEANLPDNHGLDAAGKAELTHIRYL